MTNWRLVKAIDMIILAVAVISLLAPNGFWVFFPLSERFFGMVNWSTILAVLLGYVIYSYNRIINM